MENIRKFERMILRAYTLLYISSNIINNYTKYTSNKLLYNSSQINRIDNLIIKIIINYIKKCFEYNSNKLIMAPYYVSEYM